MNPEMQLVQGLDALGVALAPTEIKKLLDFLQLLGKWNRVYNLTAVRDQSKMVTHHLLDSLAVLPHIPARRLLDVGSGGGLPGIPLAIARGDVRVTLLDSNHKKCAFLKQAAIDL
jgi:16S rRNA (guanine527-N7)-methyltransferase